MQRSLSLLSGPPKHPWRTEILFPEQLQFTRGFKPYNTWICQYCVSPRLAQNERSERNESPRPSTATNSVPSNIQSWIQSCFPTIGRRPRKAAKPSKTQQTGKGVRPKKIIIHRDLILLPHPGFDKVPTYAKRIALEERQLVSHELPFNKDCDARTLKNAISTQFPMLISFEFVKVSSCCTIFSSFKE